jgi:hypothetical protein
MLTAMSDLDQIAWALFALFAITVLICWAGNALARWNVVVRNGIPYCRNCNRQVSWNRSYCRACGAATRVYGPDPAEATAGEEARERDRYWKEKARHVIKARRATLWAERKQRWADYWAMRKQAREEHWIARGVEPGPLAWYRALPEWGQALTLGLAIGAPVALLTIAFFVLMGR